jgi:ankyrin repeat protein
MEDGLLLINFLENASRSALQEKAGSSALFPKTGTEADTSSQKVISEKINSPHSSLTTQSFHNLVDTVVEKNRTHKAAEIKKRPIKIREKCEKSDTSRATISQKRKLVLVSSEDEWVGKKGKKHVKYSAESRVDKESFHKAVSVRRCTHTDLFAAVLTNSAENVSDVIKNGYEFDSWRGVRDDPLVLAVDMNNIEIVKILVEKCAYSTVHSFPALISAIEKKFNDIAIYFIKSGVFEGGERIGNAFTRAVQVGNVQIVKVLVESGELPVASRGAALLFAVEHDLFSILELLLRGVTNASSYKERLLYTAVKYENLPIIKLLLEHGENPARNNYESFLCAGKTGQFLIFEMLLRSLHGHIRTEIIKILVVAAMNDGFEIVKYFFEYFRIPKSVKQEVLLSATYVNNVKIAMFAIDNGADVKTHGRLILTSICKNGHEEMFDMLMLHDIDLSVNYLENVTLALKEGHEPLAAKIFHANRLHFFSNTSALLLDASSRGKLDSVEFILKYRRGGNYNDQQALIAAFKKSNIDVFTLLLRKCDFDVNFLRQIQNSGTSTDIIPFSKALASAIGRLMYMKTTL